MVGQIKDVLLRKGALVALLGGSGSVGAVFSFLDATSTGLPRLLAVYFLGMDVLFALRWLTHLRWYLFAAKASALLRALVGVEGIVAGTWGYVGWRALEAQSALTVCIASAIALPVVWVLSAEISGLVDEFDLETASAQLDKSWLGQRVQLDLLRARLDALLEWFGDKVARGEISRFISLLLTLITLGFLASLASAIVGHRHTVKDLPPAAPKVARLEPRRRREHHGGHGGGTPSPGVTSTTNSTTQSSPSGKTSSTSEAATAPTYQQLCGDQPTGEPAPEPLASDLAAAFLTLGQPATGCAETPTPVGRQTGTWTMGGLCGGQLWSLTVTAADGDTGVLLGQQAASLGLTLAAEHMLIAVSNRTPIGSGQGYVMETTTGAWLLLREKSSTGAQDTVPTSCDQVPDDAVRFQVLPPDLASIYLTLVQTELVWPSETSNSDGLSTWVFETPTRPARAVAQGACTEHGCVVELSDGRPVRARAHASLATFTARFG